MKEIPKALTKAEILRLYPPKQEIMNTRGGIVASEVSRNSEGKIIFVVPGSTKWIQEPPDLKKGIS